MIAPRRLGLLAGAAALALGATGCTPSSASTATAADVRPLTTGFPHAWQMYAGGPEHNAAVAAPGNKGVTAGYAWNFRQAGALPLDAPAKDQSVLGARGAPVKTTQFLGDSVGVSAVDGVIYSESDLGYLYAINAATGRLIWQAQGDNAFMGNPVVAHGVVVAGTGDTGFAFSQVMKFMRKQPAVRGIGWSAVYGFDQRTGRQLWRVPTLGEDMSSLGELHGVVFEGTGDGHVLALDIRTGRQVWSTAVGGFDSMSSAAVVGNTVYVGFSAPNYLYALNATTGAVEWKTTVAGVANTGMGDNSPSVDPTRGLVVQDSVVDANPATKTMNLEVFAANAKTGALVWTTKLGRGAAPPAYKAGITMIHNGVVYVGSPATSTLYALDEMTGRVRWTMHIPNAGPAGAGRGGATFYHGVLWLAAGPKLYAINPTSGSVLGTTVGGGRYGIVNPVIVGGTMFLANSWGWTQAVPLSRIYPGWRAVGGS